MLYISLWNLKYKVADILKTQVKHKYFKFIFSTIFEYM